MIMSIHEHEKINISNCRNIVKKTVSYADAEALRSIEARIGQIFTWGYKSIAAKQWIGVINLGELTIEILPKIVSRDDNQLRDIVFTMFKLSHDIPIKDSLPAKSEFSKNGLIELMIQSFLDKLDMYISEGIIREYVKVSRNSDVIKGKIDIVKQITKSPINISKNYCKYSIYTINNEINSLIKTTVLSMINFTKNNLNQSRLVRANAFFDSIETMNIDSFNFGKPRNNRNNKVLGVLLKYIKLFHEGFSVSYKVGDNDSYSMLFDMNKVYERFIAESYKNIFKGNCTFSVNEYLLRSIKSSEQRQKLRPDVLLKHLDKFIIIDTKWKSIKGFPSESDLYQMYAYGNSIKNVEKTILLYPLSDVNQLQSETYKFNTDKDVVVSIQTVDLRLVNNKKVFEQHLIDILS